MRVVLHHAMTRLDFVRRSLRWGYTLVVGYVVVLLLALMAGLWLTSVGLGLCLGVLVVWLRVNLHLYHALRARDDGHT